MEQDQKLIEQYKILCDTYARYFDLYLRGLNFYLVASGALMGFALTKAVDPELKRLLFLVVFVWSGAAVFVVVTAMLWAKAAGRTLRCLEERLGMLVQSHRLGVLAGRAAIAAALILGAISVQQMLG